MQRRATHYVCVWGWQSLATPRQTRAQHLRKAQLRAHPQNYAPAVNLHAAAVGEREVFTHAEDLADYEMAGA